MSARYKIHNHHILTPLCIGLFAVTVTGCANMKGPAYDAAKQDELIFSQPMRPAKDLPQSNVYVPLDKPTDTVNSLELLVAPTLNTQEAAVQARDAVMPDLADTIVSRLAFNNMPVPVFINEVFGNQLGLNYVVEPSLKSSSDLVTMRINEPVNQQDLYELATQTLKSYGVTTSIKNNAVLFAFSENASSEVPLLVSGRTLPEVPSTSRPIFHIYPLKAVAPSMVRTWLTQMFPKKVLDVKEDPYRNALIFIGPNRLVAQAIAATQLLDKPAMEGMFSRIIRPTLSTVDELASNLENVLNAEGYAVRQTNGTSAIRLLPLGSINQLVVFAKSEQVLSHIIDWARTLETEQHNKVEQGLFTYSVQSTQATHIVEILNSLGVAEYSGSSSETSIKAGANTSTSPQSRGSSSSNSNVDKKGRYAVDGQLNTILYSGSGKDWLQILPVIKSLDKPAPSVMVEVILAEVTLNDTENTGIEWLANSTLGRFALNFSTMGGGGLATSLFSTSLDNAGQTRAVLNAFYKNEKANIRSRPRIMVKSGGEASIDVGNEIPVITSTSQSTDAGNAPVIQTVNYRKTGVLLSVKPTVHASGFVDIEIDQELSEASSTTGSSNPTILNRKLSTTVTLRDGGSVLLGGLISSSTSAGNQGVPILGKLPVLGKLFRTDSDSQDRTELMIMIIPYILNSPDEAEQLTDELQKARIDKLSADMVDRTSDND
jgi:general secretion pathway protein D